MVYVFLADGFEEIEALTPVDVLRRAGIETATVSIKKDLEVTGAHGIRVIADITLDKVDASLAEMTVLPGGMPGASNLDACKELHKILDKAGERGAFSCAICAAPMILGRRGELSGKRAVCFPGFEKELKGAVLTDAGVVRDGRFITSKGMGRALEFGLALVEALKGKETSDRIGGSVFA